MVSCICRRWIRQQKPVIEVNGEIEDDSIEFPVRVFIWAASPADSNQSFTGSRLPFANAEMAFGNNSVVIENHTQSSFKVTLLEPNAFYDRLGSVYVPPTIFAKVQSIKHPSQVIHSQSVVSNLGTPYRALSYTMPKGVKRRTSSEFYAGRESLPIRT